MKKVATFLAGVVGVAGVALLLPANVFAVCPPTANQTFDLCSGGGEITYSSADAGFLDGKFWIQGQGTDTLGTGIDSGAWTGHPSTGTSGADGNWITDFGLPDSRCLGFDWGSAGTDGCPDGSGVLWVTVFDGKNRGFMASVDGGLANATRIYDFSAIINGGVSPNFGSTTAGLTLGRAVSVATSSTISGKVSLNVSALAQPNYSETGSRTRPGTVRLHGINNALDVLQTGSGAQSILVDPNTDVCWETLDGGIVGVLGCVHTGGLTPSQNVQNAKVTPGRGELIFSWEVSAQFDVLGFNVIQKNVSKNTERTVNDTLIPINGQNDAQAASYNFSAGRKDLQATRGGFEIELVRTNGETSRTPAPLR